MRMIFFSQQSIISIQEDTSMFHDTVIILFSLQALPATVLKILGTISGFLTFFLTIMNLAVASNTVVSSNWGTFSLEFTFFYFLAKQKNIASVFSIDTVHNFFSQYTNWEYLYYQFWVSSVLCAIEL